MKLKGKKGNCANGTQRYSCMDAAPFIKFPKTELGGSAGMKMIQTLVSLQY